MYKGASLLNLIHNSRYHPCFVSNVFIVTLVVDRVNENGSVKNGGWNVDVIDLLEYNCAQGGCVC